MAEIDTPRRVTRGIHLFDKLLDELPSFDLCITQQQVKISGSIAAMENERRTKKVNDHIPLNLLEEIEHAKLVKRKKGSKVKTNLVIQVGVKKEQSSRNKRKMKLRFVCFIFFSLMSFTYISQHMYCVPLSLYYGLSSCIEIVRKFDFVCI